MTEQDPQQPPDTDTGRPGWLPRNFAEPEALVASWREGQAALTRAHQALRAYEREADVVTDADVTGPAEQADRMAELALNITPATAVTAATDGLALLEAKYGPEFRAMWPDVQHVIAERPELVPDTALQSPELAAAAYEVALNVARSAHAVQQAEQMKAQTHQEMARARESAKQAAQSMSGRSMRTPALSDEQAAWEKIASAGSPSYESLRRG